MKTLLLATVLLFAGQKEQPDLWHVKLLDCSGSVIQEWDTVDFDYETDAVRFVDAATGHDIRIQGTILIEKMR